MTRLFDRIMADGCKPFRMTAFPELGAQFLAHAAREAARMTTGGEEVSEEDAQRLLVANEPRMVEVFERRHLEGVVVIAADEVADYVARLSAASDLADLVTTVAPPFDRFFVELHPSGRQLSRIAPLHSYGVLFERGEFTTGGKPVAVPVRRWFREVAGAELPAEAEPLADHPARWILSAALVVEPTKYDRFGPVGVAHYPLGEDGTLMRLPDGAVLSYDEVPAFTPAFYDGALGRAVWDRLEGLVLPAMFAISLMHCKNVSIRHVDPSPAMSKKHARKKGRPLARYHVLEIAGATAALDGEGQAATRGLGAALHLCRGHFKTFGPEAPLFGKLTGQFWWQPHARGDRRFGRVASDFQVRLPPTHEGTSG